MATKLHPVGDYVYDSVSWELNSPEGCTLERDGQIYGDGRKNYSNVVKIPGKRQYYFVPLNEVLSKSSNLEKKISSELDPIRSFNREKIKLKKTLPILYFTEVGVGVGIILAEFFSGR